MAKAKAAHDESTVEPQKSAELTELVRALAESTAWAKAHQKLNDALQPFLGEGLTLEHINDEIESAKKRRDGIDVQIQAAEEHLASVKDRITFETDARKAQVDNDFAAYAASLDSNKRQLESQLHSKRAELEQVNEELSNKSKALAELNVQIDDKLRELSDVKAKIASVVNEALHASK